ncbi:MAG TPA: RodZ domain-containing protein [Nitrococcus sp.]|nr:RodZ domain-containing protein [Nitrococcus sp.]
MMASSERLHAEVEIESLPQERRGPGLNLRQARERCRLTVASVADTLHLEQRVIEALEADDYRQLPPITYVRGYLSAYARLVNLPVADVLQAFERVGMEERSRPLTRKVGAAAPTDRGTASVSVGSSWLLALAFTAVLVSGWMFWTQYQARPTIDVRSTGAGTPATPVGAGAAKLSEPKPIGGSQADAAATSAFVPKGSAVSTETKAELPALGGETLGLAAKPAAKLPNSDSIAVPEATAEKAKATAAPAGGGAAMVDHVPDAKTTVAAIVPESAPPQQPAAALETLKVDATGKSWVDVQDAGGQRLVYGLLERGDSRRVSGRPPFDITIGDATRVVLHYEGARVDLGPYTHGKVARFTLTAKRN